MPNILHRLSIDAPPERVHQLAATREGIQRWWTATRSPATTRSAGNCPSTSAIPPTQLQPSTRITYALKPRDDGGTTLLFSHEGWQQENEFMNVFNAYPGGEISRWD